jgi:hypothetical protein
MTSLLRIAAAGALALTSTLSAQAPPPPTTPCAAVTGLQVVCGHHAPEDLIVLPGAQWVVAGAYTGTGGVHLIGVRDQCADRARAPR